MTTVNRNGAAVGRIPIPTPRRTLPPPQKSVRQLATRWWREHPEGTLLIGLTLGIALACLIKRG
jgi:hypothetical protein